MSSEYGISGCCAVSRRGGRPAGIAQLLLLWVVVGVTLLGATVSDMADMAEV